jgi:nicotinic acid mononucleotide adenylyltransferase
MGFAAVGAQACYKKNMTEYLRLSEETLQHFRHIQAELDQLDPAAEPQVHIVPDSPQPQGGVIVFAGSFNPPTNAHLGMLQQAQQYAQQHEAMQVYAALSKQTVDKESVERPLLLDRVMLLDDVLRQHLPHTGVLLFNRGLYVEQAQALHNAFPLVQRILFLMGFDKIVQIFDPHYYTDRDTALNQLFALAELLVAPRGNGGQNEIRALLQQPHNARFAPYVHILPFTNTYRNISSTRIRQGIPEAMQDVPEEVRRFIRETHVYAHPLQQPNQQGIDYYQERVNRLQALLRSTRNT